MFSKHTLVAKILKEAKDQGITLAVAKPVDDTEYKYGIDGASLSNPDKGYENATSASPVVVPKLTGKSAEEYLNRREQLRKAAEKMARDTETTERALAHFRKFDLTEEGIASALKYISSMMPKHWEVSTDGKILDYPMPTRFGMAKRLYIVIEDRKSGYSSAPPVDVIDGKICIPSKRPRRIKNFFIFQLKQHLDYELRFKKRDQDRYNTIFTKKENEDV